MELRPRGFNTADNPRNLQPGFSVDNLNVWFEGGQMKTRPHVSMLAEIPGRTIKSVFFAKNIGDSTGLGYLLAITDAPDGELWSFRWNNENLTWGAPNNLGNLLVVPLAAFGRIHWLEFGESVLISIGGAIFETDGEELVRWDNGTAPGDGIVAHVLVGLPEDGTALVTEGEPGYDYISVFYDDLRGIYGEPFGPTNVVLETGFAPNNAIVSSWAAPLPTHPVARKLRVFRRDTVDGETDFTLVHETTVGDAGWSVFIDDVPNADKNKNIVFDHTSVFVGNLWDALGAYQNRIVWGTPNNDLAFSKINDPFNISADNSAVAFSETQNNKIAGFKNYFGTGVILTIRGIYHLVGTIADLVENSNYQIYKTIPDLQCVPVQKVLLHENFIYIIATSGLYIYNARELDNKAKSILPTWKDIDSFSDAVYAADTIRKLILIHFPHEEVTFVYHYESGDWSKWSTSGGQILDMDAAPVSQLEQPFTDPDVSILYPIIAYSSIVGYLYKQTIAGEISGGNTLDSNFNWYWISQEFINNTEVDLKRWLEARLSIPSGSSTGVTFSWRTELDDYESMNYSLAQGKANILRVRLRRRSRMLQIQLSKLAPDEFKVSSIGIE